MAYTNTIKSIAIGSFDGIHLAHKTLIDQVEALVIIERNGGYLTPGYKRSLYTSKICCFYHFEKVRELSTQAFVQQLQEDFPALEKIVVGYDFAFGKGKSGDAEHLKMLFDGEVAIVNEVLHAKTSIHSRTIKAFLKEGKIEMANDLLGRYYQIDGSVIKGQGLGKKELVPTINLKISSYQLPLEGVYATRTKLGERWYDSVSFLGHRVCTDGSFAVETHILSEDFVLAPNSAWLEFRAFIRENKKFETLDVLLKQIKEDIKKAELLLS